MHHAVCAVVAPLFERARLHRPHVRQPGGQGDAPRRYERLRNRYRHVVVAPERSAEIDVLIAAAAQLAPPVNFEVFTYPIRRRIPTVNVAVAMTVPTIQRTSLVSRFAIPVRCAARRSASRAACRGWQSSARTSARPALN